MGVHENLLKEYVFSQQNNLIILSKENNELFHIALPYDIIDKIIAKTMKKKIDKEIE